MVEFGEMLTKGDQTIGTDSRDGTICEFPDDAALDDESVRGAVRLT